MMEDEQGKSGRTAAGNRRQRARQLRDRLVMKHETRAFLLRLGIAIEQSGLTAKDIANALTTEPDGRGLTREKAFQNALYVTAATHLIWDGLELAKQQGAEHESSGSAGDSRGVRTEPDAGCDGPGEDVAERDTSGGEGGRVQGS